MFLSAHLLEAHAVNPQEFVRCFMYLCTFSKALQNRLQVLGRCTVSEQVPHAVLVLLQLGRKTCTKISGSFVC